MTAAAGAAGAPVILAIDEGTTGTRAGLVDLAGATSAVRYRPVDVLHPFPGGVEQDATQIWERTLDVCREVVALARERHRRVVGVALAAQRATAVLWDARTGHPYGNAVVWQDTRHATELAAFEDGWDDRLRATTGRPVGGRSILYWAARRIAGEPELAAALRAGTLRFGTMDTWLAWNLTGGATTAVSATLALSYGGYLLAENRHDPDWVAAVGFPSELLPPVLDDDGDFGRLRPGLLGLDVPILAVLGDQHAALIGLAGLEAGEGMCMHGTGTFVEVGTGLVPAFAAGAVGGVTTQVGWRSGGVTHYSLETFCPTTGSALEWMCHEAGFFADPREVSALAVDRPPSREVLFVPALGGSRTPHWEPNLRGAFVGLSLATTRAELARATLDGIAHAVCDALEGIAGSAGPVPHHLRCGGGVAGSDVLMQAQADYLGRPVTRVTDSSGATLRGAAYLAGVRCGLWDDLAQVARAQPVDRVFEPGLSEDERGGLRERWREVVETQLYLVRT